MRAGPSWQYRERQLPLVVPGSIREQVKETNHPKTNTTGPNIFSIITSILLATTPVISELNVEPRFLLSKGTAGLFTLWSRISTPYSRYSSLFSPPLAELTDLRSEGMFSPAFKLYMDKDHNRDKPSLIAELGCMSRHTYMITELVVYDERFKTAHGIGVGSTLDELRARHEVGSLTAGGGHRGLRAPVPDLDMKFALRGDDWPLKQPGGEVGESMIPGDAKIWRIFVR